MTRPEKEKIQLVCVCGRGREGRRRREGGEEAVQNKEERVRSYRRGQRGRIMDGVRWRESRKGGGQFLLQ